MAEQTRKKPRGKQPITRHPLFPATLALWCGALLALPGLAFAAPLGGMARTGIALALALVGIFAGLILARRIAGSADANRQATVKASGPVAQPVELSESESALWSELRDNRRILALDPAEPAQPPEPAETLVVTPAEPELLFEPEPEPEPEPLPEPESVTIAAREPDTASIDLPPAVGRIASAPLAELSHVELLERLALSLQRRGRRPLANGEARPQAPMPFVPEAGYEALLKLARPASLRQVPSDIPAGESGIRDANGASMPSAPRAFERPAVATGPQDPEQAERALRDALSALQRISGAA